MPTSQHKLTDTNVDQAKSPMSRRSQANHRQRRVQSESRQLVTHEELKFIFDLYL